MDVEVPIATTRRQVDAGAVLSAGNPVSRTPVLVGRSTERARIEAWADALHSRAGGLVLAGGAGIGKTALWSSSVASLSRSATVLVCRPDEIGQAMSYSGLADLLDARGDEVDALPEADRVALRRAVSRDRGEEVEQPAVAQALTELLRRNALDRSVVVAIDDVERLDPATSRVLGFAARRLEREPVGVLATQRSATPPSWLTTAWSYDAVTTLELRGLELDEVDELVQRRLGAALLRETLSWIREQSGGSPLYAIELARARLRPVVPGSDPPAPATLTELVERRVAAVGRVTREALLVVAAQSRPTVTSVRQVLGNHEATGLLRAVDAGLLELEGERLRFTHPLLAAAVVARAEPARVRRVHTRLAQLTEEPEERAVHVSAGTELPDAEAAGAVEAGAAAAWARGAPETAARLAERAAVLTPAADQESRVRRSMAAVDFAFAAGEDDRCSRLLAWLESALPAGPRRAEVLRRRAACETWSVSWGQGAATLRRAAAEAGRDGAVAGAVQRDLAFARMQSGDVAASGAPARMALRLAGGPGRADAEAILWLSQVISTEEGPPSPARLRRAADAETEDPWFPGGSRRVLIGAMLKWLDQFEESREVLQLAQRTHWERQEDGLLLPVLFQLGELECWAGRYDVAEELGELSLQTDRRLRRGHTTGAMRLHLTALATARRGRLEEARSLAEQQLSLATAAGDGRNEMRAMATLGFVALSASDHRAAVEVLADAQRLQERLGYLHPGVIRSSADLLEALVGAGETARARELLDVLAARSTRARSAWGDAVTLRCRGLLALATGGDKAAAVTWLRRAADAGRRQPDPLEHGRCLLALGAGLRRARQRVEARATLHEATEVFDGIGAEVWRARCVAELTRAGERAAGSRSRSALTPMQASVVDLLVTGSSNKEIAARLFVSTKTVEAHLSAIYRELGVRSRTELAARRLSGEGFPRSGEG
jgi:DNA-binding CsgD family transcriptional regulator/tetratricopeptide (TPR) repeat protein